MKKYLIPLIFSFCFIASAMQEDKPQLSENQLDALEEMCKPFTYPHCMDRARRYLTNTSPEYGYTKTEEFVDAALEALSIRFKLSKISIAQELDIGLTNEWLEKNNAQQ